MALPPPTFAPLLPTNPFTVPASTLTTVRQLHLFPASTKVRFLACTLSYDPTTALLSICSPASASAPRPTPDAYVEVSLVLKLSLPSALDGALGATSNSIKGYLIHVLGTVVSPDDPHIAHAPSAAAPANSKKRKRREATPAEKTDVPVVKALAVWKADMGTDASRFEAMVELRAKMARRTRRIARAFEARVRQQEAEDADDGGEEEGRFDLRTSGVLT